MKVAQYFVLIGTFLALWYGQTKAANILFIDSVPSPSHTIWDKTIAMALRQRGHNITFVTHTNEKSMDNFTAIHIEGIFEELGKAYIYEEWYKLGPTEALFQLYEWFYFLCDMSLKSNGIKQLMKQVEDNVKYDLILLELNAGHCFYPFIEKFKFPPVVGTSPFGLQYYNTFQFGIDVEVSYSPLYSLPYSDKMAFFQRLTNYFYTMLHLFWHNFVYMPSLGKRVEEYFGKDIMHYQKLDKHISFLLVNYDPNLDFPRSVPPAVIPVGGLHAKRGKPLPQDLQFYLDKAKHGAILFSLGSNIRSESIDPAKRRELIKAFSQLKQIVFWKFETDIENLPKNVIVRPWLPQNDILAHASVKLFITHGGALSVQEAIYHKQPIVGIPFVFDQHVNVAKIVTRKLGVKIDFSTLTAEIVLSGINEVLSNPAYKRNAEKVSRVYRDQPEDALTRAVFWVEYALRHGSGQHLRLAPRDMPAYQIYYLDIWAFVIAVLLIIYIIICKLCTLLFGYFKNTKLKSN